MVIDGIFRYDGHGCFIDPWWGVRLLLVIGIVFMFAFGLSYAQSRQGDVVGELSGGVLKYQGEMADDMFGPAAFTSIRYAVLDRLWVEGRFGIGEYRWKITDAKIAAYPTYFGQGAQLGNKYPGSLTTIEPENESRATMADLLVSYVLVDDIPSSPFVSAGFGLLNVAPSNSSEHSALPNAEAGLYPRSVIAFIVGGGVHIPISNRVGLLLRGEHRFVMSEFLDDVSFSGKNDALNSFSIGFTYRFNNRDDEDYQQAEEYCDDEEYEMNCDECDATCCNVRCLGDDHQCCNRSCCCCSCCCCCCCCGKGGGLSTGGGQPTPAASQPPASAGAPEAENPGPAPEPMDVPCPKGQHRECFGPPGMGICVDNDPPRGPEKIRWDLSRKLEDGSDLRETEGKWYRRQRKSDGKYRITKGLLPFEATECKECKEKLLRGQQ